ncbi:MAG TPA: hypothetical protein VMX18_01680 [Candidatus Bipolaricaulota bacterium]|nr:hypothetical protein [Candidatus Bipolaricaulota bacterium]
MFLINKLAQFLTSIMLVLTIEIIMLNENLLWIFGSLSAVLVFFALLMFNRWKLRPGFWGLVISPLIYVISSISFSLFLNKGWTLHLFAVFSGIVLFLYLGRILDFKFYPARYQPYSLENFSWYLNILTVFLFCSFVYAMVVFLKINSLFLALTVLLVSCLLTYQLFWVNKIKFSDGRIFVFSISFILVELFGALYYLPTSYFVNGLVMTIAFYLMTGLARFFLLGSLDKKRIINFVIISAVCFAVILLTAQWI